jgi:hypothetical protein
MSRLRVDETHQMSLRGILRQRLSGRSRIYSPPFLSASSTPLWESVSWDVYCSGWKGGGW